MSTRADELRAEAERQRQSIAADLELVGDRVSPGRMAERRKAAVRQRVTDVRTRVMGAVPSPSSSSSGGGESAAHKVRDQVGGAASSAASTVGDAPQMATQAAQGNPLGAGLVAFGAGLLVATLLPESEQEQRLAERMQPQADQLAAGAGQAARQAADEVRPQAEEAAQAVTESAKESAHTVRDEAKGSAQEVREGATQEAQQAKGSISSS